MYGSKAQAMLAGALTATTVAALLLVPVAAEMTVCAVGSVWAERIGLTGLLLLFWLLVFSLLRYPL